MCTDVDVVNRKWARMDEARWLRCAAGRGRDEGVRNEGTLEKAINVRPVLLS